MMPVLVALLAGTAALLLALASPPLLRRLVERDTAWIERVAARFTPGAVPVRRYATVYLAVRLVVLVALLWLLPSAIAAIGLWALLLVLPGQLVEVAWERRRRRIDEQMPAAIAGIANHVSAGLTLVQSLERSAEHAPEPIRTEFRIMANRYGHGASLDEVLLDAKERMALPNFNIFASALLLNREMGGDVAVALDRISHSLSRLQEMQQTIKAATSEGRTNIRVLLLAPAAILLLLYAMDPEGVALLFQTPQGMGVLAAAALLTLLGALWARQIIGKDI